MFPHPASLAFVVAALLGGAIVAQDPKPQTPPASATFTCVVVDGRTQVPIADAEVRWYEQEIDAVKPRDRLERIDAHDEMVLVDYGNDEARAARTGHVARTDGLGRVEIPSPIDHTILIAHSGSLWGRDTSFVNPAYCGESKVRRIALRPDCDIVVDVCDVSGSPAPNVPIAIQSRSDTSRSFPHTALRSVSDAHGAARFAHAGFELARILHAWDRSPSSSSAGSAEPARIWTIAPEICAAHPPEIAIDPNALPTAPIEMHLPPLGEVELVVSESDGRAASLERRTELMLAANIPADVGVGPTRGWRGGPGPRVRVDANGGRAVVRNVAIGDELAFQVQPNPASLAWFTRFQGPAKSGERVHVEMKLESNSPTFVARLVDPTKRPLANARVAVNLFSRPGPTRTRFSNRGEQDTIACGSSHVTTDADGRLWITYANDSAYGGDPVLVLCVARNQPDSRAARVELTNCWSAGAHDLGDILLAPTPMIASGKVVDADGKPIAEAAVEIGEFKAEAHTLATTDANGEFALRSAEPYEQILIHAQAKWHRFGSAVTAPGANDVRIMLAGSGAFEARVLAPSGSRVGDFFFYAERTEKSDATYSWHEYDPAQEELHWENLEPGTYRLFVRRGVAKEAIPVRDDIVLRGGELTRLEPIDLVKLLENR